MAVAIKLNLTCGGLRPFAHELMAEPNSARRVRKSEDLQEKITIVPCSKVKGVGNASLSSDDIVRFRLLREEFPTESNLRGHR